MIHWVTVNYGRAYIRQALGHKARVGSIHALFSSVYYRSEHHISFLFMSGYPSTMVGPTSSGKHWSSSGTKNIGLSINVFHFRQDLGGYPSTNDNFMQRDTVHGSAWRPFSRCTLKRANQNRCWVDTNTHAQLSWIPRRSAHFFLNFFFTCLLSVPRSFPPFSKMAAVYRDDESQSNWSSSGKH